MNACMSVEKGVRARKIDLCGVDTSKNQIDVQHDAYQRPCAAYYARLYLYKYILYSLARYRIILVYVYVHVEHIERETPYYNNTRPFGESLLKDWAL